MSNPPPNLPFAPSLDDQELEAELEHYRPTAPAASPITAPAVPAPAPEAPMPAASAPTAQIRAMPEMVAAPAAGMHQPEDMFSNLDQSPKPSAPAPTRLGDLPARSGGTSSGLKYALIFVGTVIVLGGLGFGFWYFAIKRPAAERAKQRAIVTPSAAPTPAPVVPIQAPTPEPTPIPTPVADPSLPLGDASNLPPENSIPAPLPEPVVTAPPGTNVPPPEPISPPIQAPLVTGTEDTDEDGLSDQRELELGTDPQNKDTDGDGVFDGDEVLKYGTNPLDRDTDRDGFIDGGEIQNGYNPRGGGKCAKPDCTI